jgi:hypothetical protein
VATGRLGRGDGRDPPGSGATTVRLVLPAVTAVKAATTVAGARAATGNPAPAIRGEEGTGPPVPARVVMEAPADGGGPGAMEPAARPVTGAPVVVAAPVAMAAGDGAAEPMAGADPPGVGPGPAVTGAGPAATARATPAAMGALRQAAVAPAVTGALVDGVDLAATAAGRTVVVAVTAIASGTRSVGREAVEVPDQGHLAAEPEQGEGFAGGPGRTVAESARAATVSVIHPTGRAPVATGPPAADRPGVVQGRPGVPPALCGAG